MSNEKTTKDAMWRRALDEAPDGASHSRIVSSACDFLADKYDALRAEVAALKTPKTVAVGADNPACNFCDKHRRDVAKIVKGRDGYICSECLGLCADIMADEGFWRLPRDRFDCFTCGPLVAATEAGKCKACGRDCEVIKGGKPVAESALTTEPAREEEFRPGLPARALIDALDAAGQPWERVEGQEIYLRYGSSLEVAQVAGGIGFVLANEAHLNQCRYRPVRKSWAEIERLAAEHLGRRVKEQGGILLTPEALATLLGHKWQDGCPGMAFRAYMIAAGKYDLYLERGGTPLEVAS